TDGGDTGGFMKKISRSNRIKNVVSLQVAREHARQPRCASNRHVSKRSNQRLLERLEGENAQLRASVVDLMLQIQALRDGDRELLGSERPSGGDQKCSTRLSNQTMLQTRMRSRRIATGRHSRRDRACVYPAIRDGSGASAPAPSYAISSFCPTSADGLHPFPISRPPVCATPLITNCPKA